jgi:hypothetical protein
MFETIQSNHNQDNQDNQDIENHILIIFPTNSNILRLFNQGFEVAIQLLSHRRL